MFLKTMRSMLCLTMMSLFALKAHAQYTNNWGTGMYGGASQCPYQVDVGDAAQSDEDQIADLNDHLKDDQDRMRKAKTAASKAKLAMEKAQRDFSDFAFDQNVSGGVYALVDHHLTAGVSCDQYCKTDAPDAQKQVHRSDKVVDNGTEVIGSTDGSGGDPGHDESPAPFHVGVWNSICNRDTNALSGDLCNYKGTKGHVDTEVFNNDKCRKSLKDWQKDFRDMQKAEREAERAKADVDSDKSQIADLKNQFKEDAKEHMREAQEDSTEGGCYDCMLAGNSTTYKPDTTGTVVSAIADFAMGGLAMYTGSQAEKSISRNNAALGYPTPPVSTFGFGYPYFMGGAQQALYGAVGGGGMAGGSFGCGSSAGGGGYAMGPNGMTSPYGMAGAYGPQGGAFGYPSSMYGSPTGGGMYNPGMGAWGMNGPWGLGGQGTGMMNPYGTGMPMMSAGMQQMGMQSPYGMQGMGMQSPYGMQGMGMQSPYGMQGMGMQSPYGMQGMGMQMPYGMQGMGMQSPYGMQGMGMQSPYGMQGMGMQSPYGMQGMGMQSPYGMQNPYAMYQEKQQANMMAGQQILGGLTSQMYQLEAQIQQVQYSMSSGGTMFPGMYGGGGGIGAYGGISGGIGSYGGGIGIYGGYGGSNYSPYSYSSGGASYLPGVNSSTVTTPTGGIPSVR
jgi:hypothetical protein